MRFSSFPFWLGLFLVLPAGVSLALQACDPGTGTRDAGRDVPVVLESPCVNGMIQLASCTPPSDGGAPTERFTDEACDAFVAAEERAMIPASMALAPLVDAPTEGEVLPGTTSATFRWHPTGLSLPHRAPQNFPRWQQELAELAEGFVRLPSAEAHCEAFSGVGYELRVSAGSTVILRVQTAQTSYTPTAAVWTVLRGATGPLDLQVMVARWSANAIVEGPYRMEQPRRFSIAP